MRCQSSSTDSGHISPCPAVLGKEEGLPGCSVDLHWASVLSVEVVGISVPAKVALTECNSYSGTRILRPRCAYPGFDGGSVRHSLHRRDRWGSQRNTYRLTNFRDLLRFFGFEVRRLHLSLARTYLPSGVNISLGLPSENLSLRFTFVGVVGLLSHDSSDQGDECKRRNAPASIAYARLLVMGGLLV